MAQADQSCLSSSMRFFYGWRWMPSATKCYNSFKDATKASFVSGSQWSFDKGDVPSCLRLSPSWMLKKEKPDKLRVQLFLLSYNIIENYSVHHVHLYQGKNEPYLEIARKQTICLSVNMLLWMQLRILDCQRIEMECANSTWTVVTCVQNLQWFFMSSTM